MSVSSDTENNEGLFRESDFYTLNDLSNMQYNNFSIRDTVDIDGTDPDTFLQENLFLQNPVSHYHFPQYPLNYRGSPNILSVISLNINSLPLNLHSFIDECINPMNHQFDVMTFCESKLTNDIQHLCHVHT